MQTTTRKLKKLKIIIGICDPFEPILQVILKKKNVEYFRRRYDLIDSKSWSIRLLKEHPTLYDVG